jgi:hypothetical protein
MMKQDINYRFWSKATLNQLTGCYEWQFSKDRYGYGRFQINGKNKVASRMAWELCFGEITSEQCVCHTCDNPKCINPQHLFLGDAKINNRDRADKGRNPKNLDLINGNKLKTHCKRGHPLSGDNLRTKIANGKIRARVCRTCVRMKCKS